MERQTALYLFLSFFFSAANDENVLQPPSIASSLKASRVPDVGGGPNTVIFLLGNDASISFQVTYGLGVRVPSFPGISLASARKSCFKVISILSDCLFIGADLPQ